MKYNRITAISALLASAVLSGCTYNSAESSDRFAGSAQTESTAAAVQSSVGSTTVSEASADSVDETNGASESISESADPLLEELRAKITENGCAAGIAYIGFVDPEASGNDIRSCLENSLYPEKYPFMTAAPIADAGGTELYAIVTKADCSVTICPALPAEDGTYDIQTDAVIYQDSDADCFLLRCNMSDLFSNAAVMISGTDGDINAFPMLSGKDGRLCTADGIYDFTVYADDNGEADDNINTAAELLLQTDEVRDRSQQGMTLLCTGESRIIDGHDCLIFALGTDRDDQFVREYFYGVCGDLIYWYDAINDSWSILGAG